MKNVTIGKNTLQFLREYDEVGYLKCKGWLFLNKGIEIIKKDFANVDSYMERYIYPRLVKGLCYQSPVHDLDEITSSISNPPFFISGDQDRYFEKFYERELYRHSSRLVKWILLLKPETNFL